MKHSPRNSDPRSRLSCVLCGHDVDLQPPVDLRENCEAVTSVPGEDNSSVTGSSGCVSAKMV